MNWIEIWIDVAHSYLLRSFFSYVIKIEFRRAYHSTTANKNFQWINFTRDYVDQLTYQPQQQKQPKPEDVSDKKWENGPMRICVIQAAESHII